MLELPPQKYYSAKFHNTLTSMLNNNFAISINTRNITNKYNNIINYSLSIPILFYLKPGIHQSVFF